MKLTDNAIKEFTLIWTEEHPGEDINPDELKKAAMTVLQAVRTVYGGDWSE